MVSGFNVNGDWCIICRKCIYLKLYLNCELISGPDYRHYTYTNQANKNNINYKEPTGINSAIY